MKHINTYVERNNLQKPVVGDCVLVHKNGAYILHTEGQPWDVKLMVTDKVSYALFEQLVDMIAKS